MALTQLSGTYTAFLGGLFISRLGDALFTFAIPWIAYELTRSAIVMGSIFAVSVLPYLFAPVVGVVVDRRDQRQLMLAADVMRAVLVGLIPVLHLLGLLELWHLYAISFVLAILALLFDVSTAAAIPHIAGGDLTRANAAYQMINQLADLTGPFLAGIIIAVIGGFHALWLDALSYGATFLTVMRLPAWSKNSPIGGFGSLFRGMAQGFRWLMRDRLNLALSLQAMVGNFGFITAFGVLMYYLRSVLHLDAGESGLNYSLVGAGGLLGSLIVVPLARRFRRGFLIPALLCVGMTGFLFAAWSPFWLAPGMAFGIAMACNVAWNAIVHAVRQETVPPDMLGRVFGITRMLTRLAMPLGAMAGGLISRFDPAAVFVVAAVAKGLEAVIALCSPIRKL